MTTQGVEFLPPKGNIKEFSSKVPLHMSAEKPPLPQPMPRVYRRPHLAAPGTGPQSPESKASVPMPQIYHLPPQDSGFTGWGPGPLQSHLQGHPSMSVHPRELSSPYFPQDADENIYQEIDPTDEGSTQTRQQSLQQPLHRGQQQQQQQKLQENGTGKTTARKRRKRSFGNWNARNRVSSASTVG